MTVVLDAFIHHRTGWNGMEREGRESLFPSPPPLSETATLCHEDAATSLLPLSASEEGVEGSGLKATSRREVQLTSWIIVVWAVLATFMPIYSKMTYQNDYAGYPYPVTVTVLDLSATALSLTGFCIVLHRYRVHKWGAEIVFHEPSWLWGPGFLFKCKLLLPPAVFFAAFISLNNAGLYHVSVGLHVVLAATQTVWIIVFAFMVQRERPTFAGFLCAAVIVVATVMVGLAVKDDTFDIPPVYALLLNTVAPFLSGVHATLLRLAVVRLRSGLMHPSMPHGLRVSILEITSFKLGAAAIMLWPTAYLFEHAFYSTFLPKVSQPALDALGSASGRTIGFLVGSVLITMSFQTIGIALCSRTKLVSGVIVHATKTIGATVLAIILGSASWAHKLGIEPFNVSALHIIGVTLILLATLAYSVVKYLEVASASSASPQVQ